MTMWSPVEASCIFFTCYLIPIATLRWQLSSFLNILALEHPIRLLSLSFFLPMISLVFTAPSSPLRLATIPVIAIVIAAYLQTADAYISNKTFIAISSGPSTLLLMGMIDYLVLQKLHLTTDGVEKTIRPGTQHDNFDEKSKPTPQLRKGIDADALGWAWDFVFNYRAINTPREPKNVPKWSYADPEYVPSRAKFLLHRGIAVITSYLILDFLNNLPPPDLKHFTDIKSGQFSGFKGQTVEDVIARLVSTALFWFSLRLTIALIYNAFSLSPVALTIYTPNDWPPYFGSVLCAFSIRKFWGVYWQQSLRNMLVGNATFWTHGIFQQRKGTLVARYLNVIFPFLLSGIVHTVLDVCGSVPRSEARTWVYFVLQAFGIMIEDAVEAVYRAVFSGKNGEKPKLRSWHKLVGYLWVFLFQVWATPAWTYGNVRHQDPVNNYILPFSVFGWAKNRMSS